MGVTDIRYIGYGLPDVEAERIFYRDIWGLREAAAQDGCYYLAAAGDDEPYVVRLRRAEDSRIDVIAFAQQSYDQLVNSPRREMKVFTEREGGVEHVGADNMSFGRDYIADWFAETLGGYTA